jgi:hypothetical protein
LRTAGAYTKDEHEDRLDAAFRVVRYLDPMEVAIHNIAPNALYWNLAESDRKAELIPVLEKYLSAFDQGPFTNIQAYEHLRSFSMLMHVATRAAPERVDRIVERFVAQARAQLTRQPDRAESYRSIAERYTTGWDKELVPESAKAILARFAASLPATK